MAEHSSQERTLEPSARRLEQARREGQVPRSRYLAHVLVLGTAALGFLLLAAPLVDAGRQVFARGLRFDATAATDTTRMSAQLGELAGSALLAVAPLLALLLVAAVLAPLSIGGFMFAPQLAAPKFDRLDPLKGLGRMVSLQAWAELGKVMLAALLVAVVGGIYIGGQLEAFAGLASQQLSAALSNFGMLTGLAFAALVAALAATALIDVPFQLFQHRRQLRMTLEEARREHKESEGDPHLKARVRSLQREMARKRMMAAVPQADVVVTNPTHFAVALKYLEGRHRAPVVVAKGADAVAEKIKELAREHKVPQLEAPPLARALYKHVEIGAEIPAALYTAVAQVLAYVFQLKRYAQGRAPRPSMPQNIDVPAELDPLAPRATA
ncbi:MAG TPA: flagellar biosynthesis protein FlhB [Burkholderiaceae bacterium]|nr:flagellar biosynthesis protein FlhB [Burkholderiaceae bacterium]